MKCEECIYGVFRKADGRMTCNFISAGLDDLPPCCYATNFKEDMQEEDAEES